MFGLKKRGKHVAPAQPLNTSADPFEALADRRQPTHQIATEADSEDLAANLGVLYERGERR